MQRYTLITQVSSVIWRRNGRHAVLRAANYLWNICCTRTASSWTSVVKQSSSTTILLTVLSATSAWRVKFLRLPRGWCCDCERPSCFWVRPRTTFHHMCTVVGQAILAIHTRRTTVPGIPFFTKEQSRIGLQIMTSLPIPWSPMPATPECLVTFGATIIRTILRECATQSFGLPTHGSPPIITEDALSLTCGSQLGSARSLFDQVCCRKNFANLINLSLISALEYEFNPSYTVELFREAQHLVQVTRHILPVWRGALEDICDSGSDISSSRLLLIPKTYQDTACMQWIVVELGSAAEEQGLSIDFTLFRRVRRCADSDLITLQYVLAKH